MKRKKITDPGHPKKCNVYSYYKTFNPDEADDCYHWCTKAKRGCIECKLNLAEKLIKLLAPIQKKRQELLNNRMIVNKILEKGIEKARVAAQINIKKIKQAMHI